MSRIRAVILISGLAFTLALAAPAGAINIVNGTFTDPVGLIFGTLIGGSDGGGYTPNPADPGYAYVYNGGLPGYGDARDWNWVHDIGGPASNAPTGLWFDLGGLADQLVVFPIIDHGPVAEESFEYTVFFSNDLVNWTAGTMTDMYTEGWSADPNIADGYTTVWTAPFGQFRYASVAHGNPGNPDPSYAYADGDAEIDAVAGLLNGGAVGVAEPGTLALLGIALPLAWYRRRKHS
jgi:hypothetical protein